MSTGYAKAPDAYRANSVLTASPQQLVVLLYDGIHRFLTQGAVAMRADDQTTARDRLGRADLIIDELVATLDMSQGEVAERLAAIYMYCRRLLSEARTERDPERIDQADRLLGELRTAWAQLVT